MDVFTIDGRGLGLERENQALRDQVADLQQLLQIKDTEIALKYRLLQSKERENALARARLQWAEAYIPQMLAADSRRATGVFTRTDLLRLNGALKALGELDKPAETKHLTCKPMAELGLGDQELSRSPESPKSGGGAGGTPATSSSNAPQGSLETPQTSADARLATPESQRHRTGRGALAAAALAAEGAVLDAQSKPQDGQAPASSSGTPAGESATGPGLTSPSKRKPPPELDLLPESGMLTAPLQGSIPAAPLTEAAVGSVVMSSILATPERVGDRMSPASTPTGPYAPPLTLPPVLGSCAAPHLWHPMVGSAPSRTPHACGVACGQGMLASSPLLGGPTSMASHSWQAPLSRNPC